MGKNKKNYHDNHKKANQQQQKAPSLSPNSLGGRIDANVWEKLMAMSSNQQSTNQKNDDRKKKNDEKSVQRKGETQ